MQLIGKKLLNIKLVKTPNPEYKYADLSENEIFDLSKKKVNIVYNKHWR